MGRTLKRVPVDFDWPQGKIWPGYMISFSTLIEDYNKGLSSDECERLELQFGRLIGATIVEDGSFHYAKYSFLEPPTGEGYQLWETTSEGSPTSPVFKTLDELCEWCAQHATTFASYTASVQEWKQMLTEGMVHHTEGNITFV